MAPRPRGPERLSYSQQAALSIASQSIDYDEANAAVVQIQRVDELNRGFVNRPFLAGQDTIF